VFSVRYGTNICVYKAGLLQTPKGSCSRVLVFFCPYSRVARSNLISVLDVTDNTCCGVRISRYFPETRVFSRSQIKTNLMQHCAVFISAESLHVSGASAHHQEYLKLVQRPLVHVLSSQVSHHITLLGP